MRRLVVFMTVTMTLLSCVREEVQEPVDVTINAGIDTKTLIEGNDVMWESGDKVTVVFASSSDTFAGEFTTSLESGIQSATARFHGSLPAEVIQENGYDDSGFIVYPSTAVDASGEVAFTLPAEQYARNDGSGSFAQYLNLSSSAVSLSDLLDDGKADAQFRNALSVLRFNLSEDVESVVIAAENPLAGRPSTFVISDEEDSEGRLVPDGSHWTEALAAVTLYPEENFSHFQNDVTYNVLVWPGTHSWMKVAVNFKNSTSYEKTLAPQTPVQLLPSRCYSLSISSDAGLILDEIDGRLDAVEGSLAEIDGRLDDLTGGQIQSLALKSEFLDNASYAPYVRFASSLEKKDIQLDYIIRPASVAKELVDAVRSGDIAVSDVFSGVLYYRDAEGSVDFSTAATVLPVSDVVLNDDVLSVSFSASDVRDEFYAGGTEAQLALEILSQDSNTSILSDFARLVPLLSSGIRGNYIEDIPVPAGVEVKIPFSYASTADDYRITAQGIHTDAVNVSYNQDFNNGWLVVDMSGSVAVEEQSVEVRIVSGETILATRMFTFVEAGVLDVTTDGPADHIGGDVMVTVVRNDFAAGSLTLNNANGTGVAQNGMVFTFDENPGSGARTATALYSIMNGSLTYNKYIPIVQYGTSTPLQRIYYADGQRVVLNQASGVHPNALNIVVLGDGYRKKDLCEGGKFERSARSAMSTFFSIEPYRSFVDRFNVYLLSYASDDEGLDVTEAGTGNVSKDTYFGSWMKYPGNTYVNCEVEKVKDVVRNTAGLTGDDYYRTIVIMLVNTDEGVGSCTYLEKSASSTLGDGYASFAVATIAADCQATNGLIKHEVGGHAFGRLADEYHHGGAAPSNVASLLDAQHALGYYRNVCTDTSYWQAFKDAGYTDAEVSYIDGAWTYSTGVYRSTSGGIMLDNNGVFNATCRHAIYERIIKQSQGASAYSWTAFLEYDERNR